ncbi:MAG: acetate--CoA ligase family protein [Planctomycetota bacterium]
MTARAAGADAAGGEAGRGASAGGGAATSGAGTSGAGGPKPHAEARAPRGLRAFFEPRSVAVVGASRDPAKVGHAVLANLLYGSRADAPSRLRGFPGTIIPVNSKAGEVLGVPAARFVESIKEPVDLAVFAIPAEQVPSALDAAGRRGLQAAIVLAAGTAERGDAGRRLEAQLRSVARNTQTRVIGPNCTGLFTRLEPPRLLNASFFGDAPPEGPVALIAQSGAIAQALVASAEDYALGLRQVVTLGEKVDVQDDELLRHLVKDPLTRVIGLHIESLEEPRSFHAAAQIVSAQKPLVVLHGGRTASGMRAARGHEGLFGVRDASLESALSQAGIHLVDTLGEFLPALHALSTQPPARGRRVAILTNGGGTAVLAADAVARAGLDVVPFRQRTVEALRALFSHARGSRNPVDLRGDARPERIEAALDVVAAAPEVDAILLVLAVQATTDPWELAERLGPWARRCDKPLLAASLGFAHERLLARDGIPEFHLPEHAAMGLKALVARGAFERRSRRLRRPPAPEESAAW